MPELANLEAALRQEFEHVPYTFCGLDEPTSGLEDFEPIVARATFEATHERGTWRAFRPFLPHELEFAPSFVAEQVREEIDAYYQRDFN